MSSFGNYLQHGNLIVDMEYRPAAWDVSPLMSTARGAARVGPRTPECPVGVRHFVEDSLSYPERDDLAIQLADTATMAPGIDEISNRESRHN